MMRMSIPGHGSRDDLRAGAGGLASRAVRPEDERAVARFLFAVLLMITALLQATFFPATGLIGVVPDFALVFLLIWSATHGIYEGLFWAFGLGIWIDLLTMDALGTHGIALLAVAAIGGATRGKLFRSGAVLPILAVVVATLAFSAIMLIVRLFGSGSVDIAGSLRLGMLTAVLNALLVPIAYGVLIVFDRWIPRHGHL
jgi:rod shape-determining protein MreD